MSNFDTEEARMRIESWFPTIISAKYRITSEIDISYNCVAWADGSSDDWWEAAAGYFWPKGIPTDGSAAALIELFKLREYGEYEPCGLDGAIEPGYEKIAIYANQDGYTHVARQLADGRWSSKLGRWEDIEHGTAECLCGKCEYQYGQLECYMKRPASINNSSNLLLPPEGEKNQ